MDLFELRRPGHVDDPSWAAVLIARDRLRSADAGGDLSEVIGKSKELVETIAKVVIAATEGTIGENADYNESITAAHRQLRRHPGSDTSQDQNVLAMSNAARSIATSLGPVRNSYGSGHGRARVPDIDEEMATVVVEAAMLWSRWALRRLGHMLADYPHDLIAAVQVGTSLGTLREKFSAAVLPQQGIEIQRSIGVAFGQQSAGGFGNATEVGVDPAINGGYDEFPVPYRAGLLHGMLVAASGRVGLTAFFVDRFVSVLATLPPEQAAEEMAELEVKVRAATWATNWRNTTAVDPIEVVASLRSESSRLPVDLQPVFADLCSTLEALSKDPTS